MKNTSSHLLGIPHTKLGWWSVGLAAASVVLIFAWSVLPGGAWLGFLCGIAGGITAVIAIVRKQERALLVWLPILPAIFVIYFIAAELLFPH
jgi:hypothetical protein